MDVRYDHGAVFSWDWKNGMMECWKGKGEKSDMMEKWNQGEKQEGDWNIDFSMYLRFNIIPLFQ